MRNIPNARLDRPEANPSERLNPASRRDVYANGILIAVVISIIPATVPMRKQYDLQRGVENICLRSFHRPIDCNMTPTRSYRLGIALILLTAGLAACGGDSTAPPTTGTLEFNVVTTGVDIDADGFLLDVDGQPRVLPANGTVSFSAVPGAHTVSIISGFAFNCDLTAVPGSSVNVVLAQTTRVDVGADCTPYLRKAILYTSEEFGGALMAMRPDGSANLEPEFLACYFFAGLANFQPDAALAAQSAEGCC
jgi:hypothetical protein